MEERKELLGGKLGQRLHIETRNGAWISAVPNRLRGMEEYNEELQDNVKL